MQKKRLSALLLAMLLVLACLPAALAAAPPTVVLTSSSRGLAVSLSGVSGSCGGLQMTMRLNSGTDITFNFDENLFTTPGTYCTYTQQGTDLTVYMVSKTAMNTGDTLSIGILPAGSSVASVLSLKLVDLNGMIEKSYENLAIRQQSSGGSSSSGSSGGSGSSNRQHTISGLGQVEHGSLQVDMTKAVAGTAVTITVTPDTGYVLSSLTIQDAAGANIPVSKLSDGRYRFTMPATNVTLQAVFAAAQFPFADVSAQMWYREAVEYVYNNGMMNGMGATEFSPNGTTTRAQIVTILHRLEGEPAAGDRAVTFDDVPDKQWFAAAVQWAAANGIVDGYGDNRFGPNDFITREQMAVILYRYCRFKGRDLTAAGSLSAFDDAGQVSSWAKDAMIWANGSGLITGKSGNILDPRGNATRAEAATVLMRFHKSLTNPS